MPGHATSSLAAAAPAPPARLSSSVAMLRQSSKGFEDSEDLDKEIDELMGPADLAIPPGQVEITPQKESSMAAYVDTPPPTFKLSGGPKPSSPREPTSHAAETPIPNEHGLPAQRNLRQELFGDRIRPPKRDKPPQAPKPEGYWKFLS